MAEYKEADKHFCRICGKEPQSTEPVEWAKFNGTPKYYYHTDCLKKEQEVKP